MPEFVFSDRYHDGRFCGQAEADTIEQALDLCLGKTPPIWPGNVDFSGHDMAGIPAVADLDRKVLGLVRQHGFCKDDWHRGRQHCRGGYAIDLAGRDGRRLEGKYGPKAAASMIYAASCPGLPIPSFYLDEASAVADLESRIASQQEVVG